MTHDSSPGSSVGTVIEALRKKTDKYQYIYMKKSDRESAREHLVKEFCSFFIVKAYHLATASYVLQDNIFLPIAYLRFSKSVKIVQLWHGTGTIKKFGQDANEGSLKKLEWKANQTITHLIVNSEYTKEQYAKSFGVPLERIFIWGLPRTDELFSDAVRAEKSQTFYEQYPNLTGKRLVLYAPTFRDQEVEDPKMELDIEYLEKNTSEDIVYLVKLHPFVAANFTREDSERFVNVSSYGDINTLLFVSDILITDYSSIIFEYCILERPMIFYAYDLENFSENGRGFYEDYYSYVPGPVVTESVKIAELIDTGFDYSNRVKVFKKRSYSYLDGHSVQRFIKHIF